MQSGFRQLSLHPTCNPLLHLCVPPGRLAAVETWSWCAPSTYSSALNVDPQAPQRLARANIGTAWYTTLHVALLSRSAANHLSPKATKQLYFSVASLLFTFTSNHHGLHPF